MLTTRFLVTSEELFPVLQPVKISQLHVVFQTGYSVANIPVGCIPRLNFKFHARGRQVILRILPKHQIFSSIPITALNSNEECNYASPHNETCGSCRPNCSSSNNAEIFKTVNRRLVFSSPSLIVSDSDPRSFKKNDNCDLSGIIQLEDELECSHNLSTLVSEECFDACWIQVKNPLHGFKVDFCQE